MEKEKFEDQHLPASHVLSSNLLLVSETFLSILFLNTYYLVQNFDKT